MSQIVKTFTSPTYKSKSFYNRLDLSPCNRFLISGSTSRGLYAWQTDSTLQSINGKMHQNNLFAQRYDVHDSEVSCVKWCKTDPSLVSCPDKTKLFFSLQVVAMTELLDYGTTLWTIKQTVTNQK